MRRWHLKLPRIHSNAVFLQTIGEIKKTVFGGLFYGRQFADAVWVLWVPVSSSQLIAIKLINALQSPKQCRQTKWRPTNG